VTQQEKRAKLAVVKQALADKYNSLASNTKSSVRRVVYLRKAKYYQGQAAQLSR
jgi:hypothetical protein